MTTPLLDRRQFALCCLTVLAALLPHASWLPRPLLVLLLWLRASGLEASQLFTTSALITAVLPGGEEKRILLDTGWNTDWMDWVYAHHGIDTQAFGHPGADQSAGRDRLPSVHRRLVGTRQRSEQKCSLEIIVKFRHHCSLLHWLTELITNKS